MAAAEDSPLATAETVASHQKSKDSGLEVEQQRTSQKRKSSLEASQQDGKAKRDASSKRPRLEDGDPDTLMGMIAPTTMQEDAVSTRDDGSEQAGEPVSGASINHGGEAHNQSTDKPGDQSTARQDGGPVDAPGEGRDASRPGADGEEAVAGRSSEPRRPSVSGPERRQGFSQEERKRGRRLFGGLLSTLSQTTANSQQKKRLEIERRQQERAQQQRVEDDKRRAEKLAKLNHARKIEQVQFDEEVMHTRHSTMLAAAHSLRTRSKPTIYYRPWELTKDQEGTIKEQIRDAGDVTEREKHQFMARKEQRLRELGVTVGEPASRDDANDRAPAPAPKPTQDKDHDENGDVMVEAEEDTVIY